MALSIATNAKQVRKWRRMLLAIGDEGATVPTTFFNATTFVPTALTTGYKDLGYITTDGISNSDSLSSESESMLQDLEPVRTDVTGREQSLTVVFGEANAWVNGLWHGKPVSAWSATKDGPWLFDDGDLVDWPFYRLWLVGQDGVDASAIYRVEYAYRAKVTAKTDRAMGSKAENFGFTFGLFKDPTVGKSFTRAQNGPALNA